MSRLRRHRADEETDVDISPLIDVVFILLIFFMVSTTFVKDNKLDIERPGAASASSVPAKAVRISIDRSGAITMDNVPVRPWMVQSRVREALAGGDVEQSCDAVEQRGLAATRRTEQNEELAYADLQVEAFQDLDGSEIERDAAHHHTRRVAGIHHMHQPLTAPAAMPRTKSLPEMK